MCHRLGRKPTSARRALQRSRGLRFLAIFAAACPHGARPAPRPRCPPPELAPPAPAAREAEVCAGLVGAGRASPRRSFECEGTRRRAADLDAVADAGRNAMPDHDRRGR